MLCWYLLALVLALILCSKYAPHGAIARSAQEAFDSSVLALSGFDDCRPHDEEEHLPESAPQKSPGHARAHGPERKPGQRRAHSPE